MTLTRAVEAGARAAAGPDRTVDLLVYAQIVQAGQWSDGDIDYALADIEGTTAPPRYTASVDAVAGLIATTLPGWWWTCGLCDLTGHASIGPDYNGPHRERLIIEWPPEVYDHGNFNADLAPGNGIHRVCYALIVCMIQALEAIGDPRAAALRLKTEEMGRS